jgi:hypothetical protein
VTIDQSYEQRDIPILAEKLKRWNLVEKNKHAIEKKKEKEKEMKRNEKAISWSAKKINRYHPFLF